MKFDAALVRVVTIVLPVLALGGCSEESGQTPAAATAGCRNTYVEENLSVGDDLFDVRLVVASQTDQEIQGTLRVERFEFTSFGLQPRIKGNAAVVLTFTMAVESGKKIGAGSGTIGAFTNIARRDGSFTDFMWRVPGSTDVDQVFVEEDRITLAGLGPNFLAHGSERGLFLRRSC